MNRRGAPVILFNRRQYWQRMNAMFGSAVILNPPFNETGGTVAADKSPQGNNGTYSNVTLSNAAAPSHIGGRCPSFNGSTSVVDFLAAPLVADFNGKEGAIRIPVRVSAGADWAVANYSPFGFQAQDTNNRLFMRTTTTGGGVGFSFFYIAGGSSKTIQFFKMNNFTDWLDVWLSWSFSGGKVDLYMNGLLCEWEKYNGQTGTLAVTGEWTGDLTIAKIGMFSAPWKGWLASPILLNRPVTAAEVRSLNPYGVILFDGDSRTNAKTYPFEAFGGSTKTYMGFKHLGTSGALVGALTTAAPANVDPFKHSNSICVFWAGVNNSGSTAQQIHDLIKTYCLARKAAGWRVLVCTEIDAQDAARLADDWHASKYQALNALLLADYTDFADGIADLGANVNLQDATNLTYYNADKVHLTAAGYTVVAGVVGAALAAM
jgi:hypothetical protein